ncbi:hypothetical protein ACM66B_003725 [Microbotryomycetes sp. NB124-2]
MGLFNIPPPAEVHASHESPEGPTLTSSIQLPPFQPTLGVAEPQSQFYAAQPTSLIMKEKAWSWSGDDFSVKDQNGATIPLSAREIKVIKDPTGKALFTLKNKLLSFHKTFIGYAGDADNPDKTEVFIVKQKFAMGGAKMIATFKNHSTQKETELIVKGNWTGGSASINLSDGRPVAHIKRKLVTINEIFHDRQTYAVIVAPGVDLALIAAVTICFDEVAHEEGG